MRGTFLLTPVLALVLAACAAPPAEFAQAPPPPAAPAVCNADPGQFAVGQPHAEALADQVRRETGASSVRALRPGQAVTMEFNAGRVNLDLDAGGRVTRVRCG